MRFVRTSFALLLILAAAASPALAAPTLWEAWAWFTNPWAAGLLLTLGMMALVFALTHPGMGAGEVAALACFGLFFGSAWASGRGEWIPVGIFLAGVTLVALEVLVLPGSAVAGILGYLAMGVGAVMVFGSVTHGVVAFLSASLVAGAMMIHLVKSMPDNPLLKRHLVLEPEAPPPPDDLDPARLDRLVGKIGVAVGMLRPNGTADFDGRRVDVVTRGEYVETGSYVEGLEVEGFHLVVQAVEKEL